ncbi:MAG: Rieske (2Fe-2S) protein [Planctomycetales bacterium]|nr:Rieske (2Fe-2S) protein [Planctomycetales bacterium]
MSTPEHAPDRRGFLAGGAAAAAAALCGGLPGCKAYNLRARPIEVRAVERKLKLVPVADLAVGGELKVTSPDLAETVLVARVDENEYRAVSIKCTHWGSEVGFAGSDKRFRCPSHGSEFAFDGSILKGPAKLPLAVYEVAVEDGHVVLKLAPA